MVSDKNGGRWAGPGRSCLAMMTLSVVGCAIAMTGAPQAAEPSPRVAGQHSTASIIDAGPADHQAPGVRLAGIDLALDPKFITYWRTPGDAGVPPVFDFDGSENLKEARVEYPAPRKFDEAGLDAFGYENSVIFPLLVTPQDPARPITLEVAFDYAVCANICLPAKAHLRLTLDGAATLEAERVRETLAEVPQPGRLGQAGPVRIDRVTPAPGGGFAVEATTPDATGTLFVEAPEGWFFKASAGVPLGGRRLGFTLALIDNPTSGPLPTDPVRLTLVSPAGSIEVPVRLDAKPATP